MDSLTQRGGDPITRDGGPPLGNVNLVFRFGADTRQAGLGYWVTPAARGSGLASRAAALLCDWGFTELGLTRIELLIEPGNLASQRVAQRLGAAPDGFHAHEAGGRTWRMEKYSLRRSAA